MQINHADDGVRQRVRVMPFREHYHLVYLGPPEVSPQLRELANILRAWLSGGRAS
jgi:hypothetical protein